jgi:hypothetical protein
VAVAGTGFLGNVFEGLQEAGKEGRQGKLVSIQKLMSRSPSADGRQK